MNHHIKIFTGSSLLVNRLAYLLDQIRIPTLVKDNKESSRLAGFGITGDSSHLYIYETDLNKAQTVIDDFEKEIQN